MIVMDRHGSVSRGDWVLAYIYSFSNIETSSSVISHKVYKHLSSHVNWDHRRIREETNLWWRYPWQVISNSSRFSCATEKMAYLGWISELEEAKELLERYRPGPEYSIGKEFIGLIPTGWEIQNVVDPRIPVRIRALHHSGIVRKWFWYSEMAEKLRNRKPYEAVGPEPLIMGGNIAQIFVIFFQGSLFNALIFLAEKGYTTCRKITWKDLRQRYILVCVTFKKND